MNNITKSIVFLFIFAIISGCSSHVALSKKSSGYQYKGEKYGAVNLTYASEISQDASKMTRLDQMNLENAIKRALQSNSLFDKNSTEVVEVEIQNIRIRNAFLAIMFGFMSGSDSIDGSVILKKNDKELADFNVSANYALGGFAGGQNDARLGWLSEKFAELTSNTIIGKQ
ncbi:hypothetical protein A9Q99_07075 [Gammaproteobacteria bacterium 45_16_T64]|nr:hypothetical protein A9Q99_07075 [Gammaproteobacteria bacterium 45_16_T64]